MKIDVRVFVYDIYLLFLKPTMNLVKPVSKDLMHIIYMYVYVIGLIYLFVYEGGCEL